MSDRRDFVPEGRPTALPRIFTDDTAGVVAFMREVLGAEGELEEGRPTELRLGDSVVMVSDGGGVREPTPACLYVYVPDVDSALARALAMGARQEDPVELMPWGDRRATLRDRWGNSWQIATYAGRAATTRASWRAGGCHCGAVRFEALLPEPAAAQDCTCSICAKTGFVHIIVPESAFRILKGEDQLTDYRFNTGVARHLFCKVCGVKAFYRPRSNPDGWSVNARCLDEPLALTLSTFDGAHWETHWAEHGADVAALSKEDA